MLPIPKQEINFSATTFKKIKEQSSYTMQLVNLGLGCIAFALLLFFIDSNTTPVNQLTVWISIIALIGMVFYTISYIYQFFDYEKIETYDRGSITILEEGILIDHKVLVQYAAIEYFSLHIDAYYEQRINMAMRTPTEQKSLGLKNTISFKTETGKLTRYFKLENKLRKELLEQILLNLVTTNKFSRLDAKRAIKLIPERFRTHGRYKEFVIQQIKAGRINCTEGLLLHGYSSDAEAKTLRSKYCN